MHFFLLSRLKKLNLTIFFAKGEQKTWGKEGGGGFDWNITPNSFWDRLTNFYFVGPAYLGLGKAICMLDILFSLNCNIHKSSHGLSFWASNPLIDKFYLDLSIKGSDAQKQRPHELYECCDLTEKVYLRYICIAFYAKHFMIK